MSRQDQLPPGKVRRRVLILLASVAIASSVAACSEHVVDTFPEWCEQITGQDLEAKYAPFWAVMFSVSFDADAIRDDYAKFLNQAHLKKVQNRTDRMAWREGTDLHLINLSSLVTVEPEKVIGQWRQGLEAAKRYDQRGAADICLYGTVTSLFDRLLIHSMESDALGRNWTDDVTVIRDSPERTVWRQGALRAVDKNSSKRESAPRHGEAGRHII